MEITIQPWSKAQAKKELKKRLAVAKKYRENKFEGTWRENEATVFMAYGQDLNGDVGYGDVYDALIDEVADNDSNMGINYAFKYHRFIHSQMSANPPSVIPTPTSTDYQDRRAAEVADAFIQHGRRKLKLQERVDLTTLQTLTYGTGFTKTIYDPSLGDAWEVEGDKITMQGDISIRPVLLWNVFIDPDADFWEDVRYVYERHLLPIEEAIARFPDKKERFEELKGKLKVPPGQEDLKEIFEDMVEVYEYYEKALPWNGMDGRHCFLLGDGELLTPVRPNPLPDASLPYHIITDIDVPGQVYGKANIEYIVRLQDILNRLDSTILDNVQAHGVVRLVVFDAAEIPDEAESNDAWDIINIKGANGQQPAYIQPPQLMPDLYKLRQQIEVGMEQIMGVNESMFGQVKREMSGFSLQTAINAGNMVRRRLFNKYTLYVESVYSLYLKLVQKHYDDKRKVLVTGEENSISVAYFSGADLTGGFDLKVEYGASFSLDPASRREEIMQLIPFLKEAGYTMRQILGMLRLNEVGALFDMATVGRRRQMEIFDEMISKYESTGQLVMVEPEKNEDHGSMLEAAKEFRMSMLFKSLEPELQAAIDQHIDDRMEMAASVAAGPAAGAAGPAAMPGMQPGPMAQLAAPGGLPTGAPEGV